MAIESETRRFLMEILRSGQPHTDLPVSAARIGCQLGLEYDELRAMLRKMLGENLIRVHGEHYMLATMQVGLTARGIDVVGLGPSEQRHCA